jgi:hypothetical protein
VKPVVFTRHAREKMVERLTIESEVIQTIREAAWQAAEMGKQRASKWYPFGKEHKGTFYTGKDVEPIFVEESDRIVVVTVYVFLNQRGEER